MATNAQTAQGLALAIFGASAGGYLNFLEARASDARALSTELAGYLKRDLGKTLSTADILANLQLKSGTAAYTAAKTTIDVQISNGNTPADAAAAVVTYLFGLTDASSDLYATSTAFKSRVDVAVEWSKGAGAAETTVANLISHQSEIDNPLPPVPVETSVNFVAGADNIVGTADVTTYKAIRSAVSAENTLSGSDKLDGGAGTDTLAVDVRSDFTGFSTGSVKAVEIVTLTNTTEVARSFSAKGIVGAATYNLDSKTGVSLSEADTLGTVNVLNRATGTTSIDFADTSVSTTTDNSLALGLTSVGANETAANKGNFTYVTVTAPEIQKLNITSTGAANAVDVSAAPLKSLTITGEAFTAVKAKVTSLTSVDASAQTGGVVLDLTTATIASVKSGSGNDRVTVDGITTSAVIAGGDGADTLTLSAFGTGTYQPTLTGFETLKVASNTGNITLALRKSTGIENLEVDGLDGNVSMVQAGTSSLAISSKGAQSSTDTISTDASGDITFTTVAADTVTTLTNDANALNVTANNADALTINVAKYTNVSGSFTVGASSVTLNASGAFKGAIVASDATDLTITASANVESTSASDFSSVNTFNATTSKSLDLDTTAVGGGFLSFGSAALTGSGSTSALSLGDLGDAESTQAISLTTTGWKGGVTVGTLNTIDSIKIDTTATTGGVVVGDIGSSTNGTVTIKVDGALAGSEFGDITTAASKTVSVSALDTVGAFTVGDIKVSETSNNPTGSITVSVNGGLEAATIGTLEAKTVTLDISNQVNVASHAAIKSLTATITGDATLANNFAAVGGIQDQSVTANSVTFKGGADEDTLDIFTQDSSSSTATNKESHALSISTGASSDAVTVTAYADQVSMTFTGTVDLGAGSDRFVITGDVATTQIDTTSLTVTSVATTVIDGHNSTSALTVLGGGAAESITGGVAADTITAGAGDDIIAGGDGNDSLTGGLGLDTFEFAATAADNGADKVNDFATTVDKLDLSAFSTTGGATGTKTAVTGAITTTDYVVYYLTGQTAGAADSAAAAAAALNTAAIWSDDLIVDITAWVVISDNNSSAIYEFVDLHASADEVDADELTLVGTITGKVVAADLIVS